ncbi:hypothetical protein AB0J72_25440 [Dactylosporangium sp. NPDC049742]|uniref:hypothetical protein n=1 Tax=Dactylosporangium sp. NPDC049742 TaxID=3154737 RepID=UPI00341D480C
MRRLRFGEFVVDVDTDDGAVADFIDRIAGPSTVAQPTHQLVIRRTGETCLVIDETCGVISLTLSRDTVGPTVQIGVLQAVTRSIAYLNRSAGTRMLLHGSAFTLASGAGVAVLDGGLGQGKTSLALAMARERGQLLVDEFAFARTTPDGVVLSAAPTLPWHIRPDMAPYLAPLPGSAPLRYPCELQATVATAPRDSPLGLILIPDQRLRAGQIAPVDGVRARSLLRRAVTDHLSKLADPRLDHVSIFTNVNQVVDQARRPLAEQTTPLIAQVDLLRHVASVPAFRVGIGAPADLAASTAAAGLAVETVTG